MTESLGDRTASMVLNPVGHPVAFRMLADRIDELLAEAHARGVVGGRRQGLEEAAALAYGLANDSDLTGDPDVYVGNLVAKILNLIDRPHVAPTDAQSMSGRMDAPDGPICRCGRPSRHESGWCGREFPACSVATAAALDDCTCWYSADGRQYRPDCSVHTR